MNDASAVDRSSIESGVSALESLLDRPLSEDLRRWLNVGTPIHAFGLPLLGLPIGPNLDNCWSATLYVQSARPGLERNLVAIRLLGRKAMCARLSTIGDAAKLVEVDLDSDVPARDLATSFSEYLAAATLDIHRSRKILDRVRKLQIDNKMTYDHKAGGKLPRAKDWRIVRSCVHDRVVGIAALRQNHESDETQVDVFEATDHPLYKSGHGIRSLTALVLADAYKNGCSLNLRFRRISEPERLGIPTPLVELASQLNCPIGTREPDRIDSKDATLLFWRLTGLSAGAFNEVQQSSQRDNITPLSVAFLAASKVWTIEEIEWILAVAPRPAGILFGDDGPENWIAYAESVSYGRAALLASMFRASLNEGGEEGVEVSEARVESGLFSIVLRQPVILPWGSGTALPAGETIVAAPLPRFPVGAVVEDIVSEATRLSAHGPPAARKFLLYSQEIPTAAFSEAKPKLDDLAVEAIRSPYTLDDLDTMLSPRIMRARRVRR